MAACKVLQAPADRCYLKQGSCSARESVFVGTTHPQPSEETVCSRVCTKWLIGCLLACVGLFGCQPDPVKPSIGDVCTPGGLMLCICAGGESTGYIPCGADRMITECGGCAPYRGAGAAGSGAVSSGLGAAGSAPRGAAGGPAANGVGAAGTGVQGSASSPAAPPAAAACGAGEVCRVTSQGSMKFCSRDPAATLPPVCGAPGQTCGSNGRGTCSSGAPAGVPTALYCVYPSC
jgi:hypothetical protein